MGIMDIAQSARVGSPDELYQNFMRDIRGGMQGGSAQPNSPLAQPQGAAPIATPQQMAERDADTKAILDAANRQRAAAWMQQHPGTEAAAQYAQAPQAEATSMAGLMAMAGQGAPQQGRPGQAYQNPLLMSLMGG